MKDLARYVDTLFTDYPLTDQVKETKQEILSNLEAKVADLISEGMESKEAVSAAVKDMKGINIEIEGFIRIDINKYQQELSQISLIACLIAWILTIPIMVVNLGIYVNYSLLAVTIMLSIRYFRQQAKDCKSPVPGVVDARKLNKTKKIVWIIWSVFIATVFATNTAIQFGSNLWFSRSIEINGPYALALLVARFALPFISIIIPLYTSASVGLLRKYEIGDNHE